MNEEEIKEWFKKWVYENGPNIDQVELLLDFQIALGNIIVKKFG